MKRKKGGRINKVEKRILAAYFYSRVHEGGGGGRGYQKIFKITVGEEKNGGKCTVHIIWSLQMWEE